MLVHSKCGAPVEVLEQDFIQAPGISLLQFYCQICKTIVEDDHDLFVIDSIETLKEMN